jgi:DNA-binding NarL/FixJ family response regulator
MRAANIVLAHRDGVAAGSLARSLHSQFRNVAVTQSATEIRSAVARLRAPLALIDLELVTFSELQQLCSDFPATAFVAIHRLADEQMWSDALAVGAADCCQSNDVNSILFAADRCSTAHPARAAVA